MPFDLVLLCLLIRKEHTKITENLNKYKWEEKVQAGYITYTADSHPKSTKPRQGNNINVNGYKNTEDTQKLTNIYLEKDGSTSFERSATNATWALNQVYER